jgi:hypothetical protein
MKYFYSCLIALVSIFFVSACEEPQKFPNEPQIDFYQIYVNDTTDGLGNIVKLHLLTFRIVDGDGNLGVYQDDTVTNNLFITFYQKVNGVYEEVSSDIPLYFRIPYTDPVGLNEYFKADIQVELTYPINIYNTNGLFDTVMYSFYVMDRDSNYSNVENTFEIPKSYYGILIDTTAFNPTQL